MPNYTIIPKEFREEYAKKFIGIAPDDIPKLSEQDPVIFGYYYLGKKARLHQAYIMYLFVKKMEQGKVRLAMCLARQLGKTIYACVLLIWSCWYNKLPATINKITIWYVVSRDDETAMELIGKMRMLLYDGDRHMSDYTGEMGFFSNSLKEPNNTQQITFLNNCFIKSIPPTKKGLGKSGNLWIDEAHRLNSTDIDSDTFFDYAIAMTSETGGAVVLSSSPEGIVGFFHRAIDPDKQYPENEYESIWFDHTIWDDGTSECLQYQSFVESERVRLSAAGRLKYWQQEYQALFTVTETSFFEHKDVDDAIQDTPLLYEWHQSPCSLGIDYGLKVSRTVLTIRTMVKDEIIQIFQYRCPADFDINYLINPDWEHSIQKLKERYNLFIILPDDCPQGDQINRWLEQNSGITVKKYNFRSDQMSKSDGVNRNCAAYSYRAKLKEGKLKIPKWNQVQQFEMKVVQEVEQKVLISIKAPTGQLCDTFDSDMMACIPFLDMQSNIDFEVDIPTEEKETPKYNGRNTFYDYFHSPTDEECRQMIKDANEGWL